MPRRATRETLRGAEVPQLAGSQGAPQNLSFWAPMYKWGLRYQVGVRTLSALTVSGQTEPGARTPSALTVSGGTRRAPSPPGRRPSLRVAITL